MPPKTRGNKRTTKADQKEQERINTILDNLIGKDDDSEDTIIKIKHHDNETEVEMDSDVYELDDKKSSRKKDHLSIGKESIFIVKKPKTMIVMNHIDSDFIESKSKNFKIAFKELNLRQYE